ncbi:MAG TPA: VCBS repeat-containing protein, partial [Acidimicrobiia bacterium]|nr:VCBS repeat-containing protein [Acidimicrobiia bacterium]
VSATVTDDDGGSDTETYEYVVVFDPSAGFVTGGGWIWSPAGAYVDDPDLEGRANFGFVAKYKKGQTTPDGQTQFQFHAGDLNFHSTSYQWLVVSGPKATYKGTGTINGSGHYGFLLTARDGQATGGDGTDLFRIKIWDVGTEEVVYDNNLGGGDDAEPATALGGGSIVIHSGGNGKK